MQTSANMRLRFCIESQMATSIRAHQVLENLFPSSWRMLAATAFATEWTEVPASGTHTRNRTSNGNAFKTVRHKNPFVCGLKCDRLSNSFINFIMKWVNCTETSRETVQYGTPVNGTHSHLRSVFLSLHLKINSAFPVFGGFLIDVRIWTSKRQLRAAYTAATVATVCPLHDNITEFYEIYEQVNNVPGLFRATLIEMREEMSWNEA